MCNCGTVREQIFALELGRSALASVGDLLAVTLRFRYAILNNNQMVTETQTHCIASILTPVAGVRMELVYVSILV